MALLLKLTITGWMELVRLRDKRVDEYFFMKSPVRLLAILVPYALFVFEFGPALMKNRPAFKLKRTIMVYNVMQILINSWLIIVAIPTVINLKMSVFCSPIETSLSYDSVYLSWLHYCYFLVKLLDLMDTVFFILRKKDNQVTFLHNYHHLGMAIATWIGCRWFPGGQTTFLGIINGFIHVVMYFYYFISSLKSEYKKNIWWKKYITQLQLAQHVTLLFIFLIPMLNPKCTFPKLVSWFLLPQCILMVCLFSEFYIKTYVMRKKKV